MRRRMRIHVLKRKSSALEGERGRPVVNIVVVPEFRVAAWGEHAACLDVVDVPIQKPSLADCGGRKEPQRHVFHQVQHRSAAGARVYLWCVLLVRHDAKHHRR